MRVKIIFFVFNLICIHASASSLHDANEIFAPGLKDESLPGLSSELVAGEDIDPEDISYEVIVATSKEEQEEALSNIEEELADTVYIDENGDEYILVSEEYAQSGETQVRFKKRRKGGKGRNCVAQNGGASWYGPGFHGRKTANGERFDQNALTAAHKTIKFNSLVRVTYQGRSMIVRINDAGPFVRGRVIDLSKGAAIELGLIAAGHGQVQLEIIRCGAEEVPVNSHASNETSIKTQL